MTIQDSQHGAPASPIRGSSGVGDGARASPWSRLNWRGALRHDAMPEPHESVVQARERARVEMFEHGGDPAALGAERRQRAAWWERQLRRRGIKGDELGGHTASIAADRRILSAVFFVGVLVLAFSGLVLWNDVNDPPIRLSPKAVACFAVSALVVGLLIALLIQRTRREVALLDALRSGACPDCRVPLGLDPGVPGPGPSRCPGCGLAWPAVPAPIPSAGASAFAPEAGAVRAAGSVPSEAGAEAPPLGPAVTRWDHAGVVLKGLRLPQLRMETRGRWTHQVLPRFGRGPSRVWKPMVRLCAVAFISVLAGSAVPDGFRVWAFLLAYLLALTLLGYRRGERWKLGAVRRARCLPFQRALAREGPEPELGALLTERRSAASMETIEKTLQGDRQWYTDNVTKTCMFAPTFLWVGYALVMLSGRPSGGGGRVSMVASGALFPLIMLVAVVCLIVGARRTKRVRESLLASVAAKRCCDCGYDLAGLPSAIDPERLDGQASGPARCPECSAPWPLVPPMVP